MSVVEDVKAVLSQDERSRRDNFQKQLKAHEEFRKWMDDAGIVPTKQKFSIPLIERIGTSDFLD